MNRISNTVNITSYKTKDRSEIRELIHPDHNDNSKQSIAEARVKCGGKTTPHHHLISEEIYITTEGSGKLYIQNAENGGVEELKLQQGINVVIQPGEIHWLENTGEGDLVILCCCSPPYSHDDTFLR